MNTGAILERIKVVAEFSILNYSANSSLLLHSMHSIHCPIGGLLLSFPQAAILNIKIVELFLKIIHLFSRQIGLEWSSHLILYLIYRPNFALQRLIL